MAGFNKRTKLTFAAAVILIAVAAVCRAFSRTSDTYLCSLLSLVSSMIHLGLFIGWGFSIGRRIIDSQIRRLLIAVDLLEIFWLTVREFKFRFVDALYVIRMLWYLYYIPVLLIPLLAVLISLSLYKNEKYRLPKQTVLLYIPTLIFIITVLTNDYHQLVFRFPGNQPEWSEENYSYGTVYYLCIGWIALCAVASLIIMVIKSRLPHARRMMWLPFIPFIASGLYIFIYALKLDFLRGFNDFNDMAFLSCLAFSGYFEFCIQCSLIPSNLRYYDLFEASVDVPVSIVDSEYNVRYSAKSAEDVSVSDMKKAAQGSIILDSKKRVHNMPVNGGYAIWTEDVSELLRIKETLEDRREELRERNALLKYEYQKEKEHKSVEEQNRLYDLMQSKTQTQLDKIELLMQLYKQSDSYSKKQRILSEIVVLGSYIKRRKDFVLSLYSSETLPMSKLANALAESYRSLRLLDIKGGFIVEGENENVRGDILTQAYDFFEFITESVYSQARHLNTSVCRINGKLRISINTDCTDTVTAAEKFPYVKTVVDTADGSVAYLLSLEGGEAS